MYAKYCSVISLTLISTISKSLAFIKCSNKSKIARETGLSRKTVYKHYDKIKAELYGNEGGKRLNNKENLGNIPKSFK